MGSFNAGRQTHNISARNSAVIFSDIFHGRVSVTVDAVPTHDIEITSRPALVTRPRGERWRHAAGSRGWCSDVISHHRSPVAGRRRQLYNGSAATAPTNRSSASTCRGQDTTAGRPVALMNIGLWVHAVSGVVSETATASWQIDHPRRPPASARQVSAVRTLPSINALPRLDDNKTARVWATVFYHCCYYVFTFLVRNNIFGNKWSHVLMCRHVRKL